MKQNTLLLSLSLLISSSLYAQNNKPVVVPSPVDKIFVPSGFDDNDNVEVVLHGNFPDSCHEVGTGSAQVDTAKRVITVKASSLVYADRACLQGIVPFIQSVAVGQLPEGSYEVVYESNATVESGLDVARRKTESPDDYLFATVEEARIDVNPETGKQALKLFGYYPYYFFGCMVIREVRVTKDPVDVLVVQPIAEIVNTEVCNDRPYDNWFEYTVGLQEPFQGEGLLHVRTMNGTSLNRFLQIP